MQKRVRSWYDRKWLIPVLAILTFVSQPFLEDIRGAIVNALGITLDYQLSDILLFDILWAGGLIGLAIVLMLKSDQATRVCEDLRDQFQEDLTIHRQKLEDDLTQLADTKLIPITEGISTLKSKTSVLDSRLSALDSRMGTLDSRMGTLDSRMSALDSRMSALDSRMSALDSRMSASKNVVADPNN